MSSIERSAAIQARDVLATDGEAALARGDWAAAAQVFEELVRGWPQNADFKHKLARAYEELGRFQDAVAVLSDPTLVGVQQTKRMLASTHMNAKNYAAALPLVEDLLASDPDDPKLGKWKARCEEKIRSRKIARSLKEAKELASTDRLEEAEQAYLNLLHDYPHAAEAHGRLAQIYIVQKRWHDAIAPFRAGLSLDPGNIDYSTGLARALFKSGNPGASLAVLERLGEGFKDQDALILQLRCCMELQDWSRAVEVAARLLAVVSKDDPLHAEIRDRRLDALAELEIARARPIAEAGHVNQAIAAYQETANRYPTSAVGWLKLGTALAEAENNDEAAGALRKAMHLSSDDAAIRRLLTRVMLNSSKEEEILHYVQEAICEQTADVDCYRWLARYHANDGDWTASLDAAGKAQRIEPGNDSARLLRARALVELGRMAEALDELDVLVSTDVKPAEVLQLKADCLLELGRVSDAVVFYAVALEKAPKDPLISYKLSRASLLNGDIEGFHRFQERRREMLAFGEANEERPFQDWQGELRTDGKLLLWVEAGFGVGKTILHLGFVKPLAALGLEILLEVDAPLVEICRRSFPDIIVVARGADLPPDISHHSPLGSLSRWFKPDLASFASARPYLLPNAELVAAYRAALKQEGSTDLLVGISLPSQERDENGAGLIDPAKVRQSVKLTGVDVVNLEEMGHSTEGGPPELQRPGGRDASDLDHLSALIAAMDLIVCLDGSAAHLAGAIGVPTRLLLPVVPAAHWLARSNRAIWYPHTVLLRQAAVDDCWEGVLDRVRQNVGEFVSSYDPSLWLARTMIPALQPCSARAETMSVQEVSDAVTAFIAQGAFAQSAYRSALELIDRVPLDQRPRGLEIQRGDLLVRFGRWEEARDIYRGLRRDETDNQELEKKILSVTLAMHDLDYALTLTRQPASRDPACRIVTANILYHLRRPNEALAELREASIEAPQTEGLSTLVGTLLLELEEFQRAESYLRREVAVTRRAEDYTLLGRSVAAQGRPRDALTFYENALSLSEDDPAANFWRTEARIEAGAAATVPLPPLLGDIPRVATEDFVLFFAADNAFFWEYGLILLASVGTCSPAGNCHVHVINPGDGVAAAVERVRRSWPELRLSYSYEDADFTGCSETYMRTYYASVRFVRLAEIFSRAPASYLCVDADCIVRGDVAARMSDLDVADVGIRMRYDERPHATVAAGALMLRPTSGAGRFIERVSTLIRRSLEAREAAWFLDQIVLSHVVRELGGGDVRITQLGMDYIDWFFRDDSLIWTGKGRRKSSDSRYMSETRPYRQWSEDIKAGG